MIRLHTLGVVDLRAPDDRVLDGVLAQPKRLALLIYLAAARPVGFHRRDRLLALFWPELDESRARDALSQALRFLRLSLGSDVLVTRGPDEVGVDTSQVWCDARSFREAIDAGRPADAMPLYRGDFLDGFFAEEASGFAEWVEDERAALRELAARGARQLAELHDARGDHTVAVAWGRRAVDFAPDDERAFRRFLGLLARAGDRVGALQAYESFARRLRTEYSAEPATETKALVEDIRESAHASVVAPQPAETPSAPAAPLPAVRFALGAHDYNPGSSLANGRYVIERVLGFGGMATVYLARDVRHERRVAVKVLQPRFSTSVSAEGLLREIRIAANLQHPHIVPLFDSGESDARVFYVMPYVAGESLGTRLRREPEMPLDLVLRIAHDVADALAYAHARGIVHRDIKPDNILLSGDAASGKLQAMVSDFGLAKAIDVSAPALPSADATLATLGGIAGTPRYMSPEQAAGDRVDHRTDVYAWGLVVYEMLAGAHPFGSRATPRQLIAAHIGEAPVPLGARRPDVPTPITSLVMRCLAKEPAERPSDGAALVAGLNDDGISTKVAQPLPAPRRRRWLAATAAVALLSGAMWVSGFWRARAPHGAFGAETTIERVALDTTRYVIIPFEYDSTVATRLGEVERLRDAFARWRGVSLVDEFQTGEALSRQSSGRLTSSEAQQLATRLGAGRYVRGDVKRLGGTVRVYAAAYDTRTNARLRDTTVRLTDERLSADTAFGRLADHLLFDSGERAMGSIGPSGSRSLPARQAFAAGQAALSRWDLAAADSQFAAASRFDDAYADAWLWLAQVRSWRDMPTTDWSLAAQRASSARDRLSPRGRVLAEALAAIARKDLVASCSTLLGLTRRDRFDFVGWYAASDCLWRDDAVVRDAASRSGWRFRTSYQQRIQTYRRALELLPSIHRALADGAFESTRVRLQTNGNMIVQGRAVAPDTGLFFAYPAWEGDTVVLVPYPAARFARADAAVIPPTVRDAVRQQRRVFSEVASVWAAAFPASAEALEALAVAMQMLGDPTCVDTLRRARRLATGRDDRLRIGALEVWTRIRFALPGSVAELSAARQLADSLLAATPVDSVRDARPLVSLAALTGRATMAAAFGRHRSVRSAWTVHPALGDVAVPLAVYGAFAGPADTLAVLEDRFERLAQTRLTTADAAPERERWFMRASVLAFPGYRFRTLSMPPNGDASYLLRAVSAFVRGDTGTTHRILMDLRPARRLVDPLDRAVDGLFIEANLLHALGDTTAAGWIDPTLDVIGIADPLVFADPIRAAIVVRLMALRAEIAAARGDRLTAQRWATAVVTLWPRADAFLQPTVRRMAELAK